MNNYILKNKSNSELSQIVSEFYAEEQMAKFESDKIFYSGTKITAKQFYAMKIFNRYG